MGIKTLFTHPILSVLQRTRLLHGAHVTRTYIDMAPAVMVVALDRDNNVHLLKEYMAPTDAYEYTFVKGRIDEGETPLAAAQRELAEELGLAGELEHLMTVHNQPSHSTAVTHIYVARNCIAVQARPAGDEEATTLQACKKPLINVTMYATSTFKCARSILAGQALYIQEMERRQGRPS